MLALLAQLDRHVADLLRVAAIQSAGHAQDGRHLPHALLIACRELAKVGVLPLGIGAAMVAGHVGDQLQLVAAESLPAGCSESNGNCACGADRS